MRRIKWKDRIWRDEVFVPKEHLHKLEVEFRCVAACGFASVEKVGEIEDGYVHFRLWTCPCHMSYWLVIRPKK